MRRYGFLISALVASLLLPGRAEVRRFAILIGSDRGLPDEKPLKYAAQDARSMAEAIRHGGTFSPDRIHVLENVPIDRIKSSLAQVHSAVEALRRDGIESLVFFYYSGHGSAEGLHISGRTLPRKELTELFGALESGVKIIILDACESGNFLRRKGARMLDSSESIRLNRLESKGTILISSSSAGEVSQESEVYRSAVFTHHFLNGIRGPADYDGDRDIRILEAFDYAQACTRKEKILGLPETQNPAFDLDMTGQSDPILARISRKGSSLLFVRMPATQLEIYDGNNMELRRKVWLTGKDSVRFSLPSGRYLLSYVEDNRHRLLEVDITWKNEAVVLPNHFGTRERNRFNAKGHDIALQYRSLGFQYGIRHFVPFGGFPMQNAAFVFQSYRARQSILLGMGRTRMEGEVDGYVNRVDVLSLGYSLGLPCLRAGWGQALVSAEGSWHPLRQRILDRRFGGDTIIAGGRPVDTDRHVSAVMYRGALALESEVYLPFWMWMAASVSAAVYTYRDGNSGRRKHRSGLEPGFHLGRQF